MRIGKAVTFATLALYLGGARAVALPASVSPAVQPSNAASCVPSIELVKHGDTAIDIASDLGVRPGEFLGWLAQADDATQRSIRRIRPGDALTLCLQKSEGGPGEQVVSVRVRHEDHRHPLPAAQPLPLRVQHLDAGASPRSALRTLHVEHVVGAAALDYAHRHWHLPRHLPRGARLSIGYNGSMPAPRGVLVYIDYARKGHHHRLYHYADARGRQYLVNGRGRILRVLNLDTPVAHARMSSGWGWRTHPVLGGREFHKGVDYAAPEGTKVRAATSGVVRLAGWRGNYGRLVEIKDNDGVATRYGHLEKAARGVRVGRRVHRGQVIGYVGSTGLSTGPHLYVELWKRGRRVNPLDHALVVRADPDAQVRRRIRGFVENVSS